MAKKAKVEQGNGRPALEIKDVQAIKYVRAELPERGGVVVWSGTHGVGKTTSIQCVSALTSKDARSNLRPRDGCECGTIAAPGIVVRIGRKNTASGELTMEMMDPECDPSVLVSPGLKDEQKRDAHRLRMLVRIGAVVVPSEQWGCHVADVVPDRVDALVAGLDPQNPVGSAEILRLRVHELALTCEQAAAQQVAKADAFNAQLVGVDLTAPSDAAMLQRAYDVALGEFSRVTAEAKAAAQQRQAVEDARAQLAGVEAALPNLQALQDEIRGHEAERSCAQAEIARIDQLIAELRRRREDEVRRVDAATRAGAEASKRLQDGRNQHLAVAELRATVEGGTVDGPSPEAIEQARIAKEAAHAAILTGEQTRRSQETARAAHAARSAATVADQRAKELRSLARSTDMVLEEALRGAGFLGLVWRDGRLYVESDRGLDGKWELFDELSEGERYRWAFDWISQKMPESSFVPLSQEAWQGLGREARQEINRLCQDRRLWLWTGQIGDGELRAEVFGGDEQTGVAYPAGVEG